MTAGDRGLEQAPAPERARPGEADAATAAMMHDFHLGRQPIFDARSNVVGYELLFRQRRGGGRETLISGDQATSRVIMHSFWELGLRRVVGNYRAFINVTRGFLLDPELLPPPGPQLVLEILEDVTADDEVTRAVRRLRARGYTIALDDFVYRPDLEPLVELADIVKLDVQQLGPDRLAAHAARLRRHPLQLLAEKIETPEEYERCTQLGFDYYQGYFLCRPHLVRGRRMPASRINALRLVASLQEEPLDLGELAALISRDMALGYRLLRYINSAALAPNRPIRSIRHAIVYLGEAEMRRWAMLLALAGIDDKPVALMTTALVRARMCERIIAITGGRGQESAFMVGLFSALDAMMDQPLANILGALPLPRDVLGALLKGTGPYADALDIALAHERGDWAMLESFGNIADLASRIYLEALEWSEDVARRIAGAAGQA